MTIMTDKTQKEITKKCISCDYEAKISATNEQLQRYQNGELIQNVFPNVSPGDRELFISGICGTCFDNMFA